MVCINSSSLDRRAGSRFSEKQAVCTTGCQLHDRGFSNGYNLLCGQHLRQGIGVATVSYARDLFVQAGISIFLALTVVKAVKKALPPLK